MDQRDLGGKIRQEQRLFHGRVATADHNNLLAAIKEPVAGRTGRNAEAFELLFRRQAQPFRPRTRTQDNGICGVNGAAVGLRGERAFGQVERRDNIAHHITAHLAGMGFHAHHQIGALHLCVTGPVFHFGCCGQLATGLNALHKNGVEHGARGVDASGIACRAGANDQNFGVAGLRHRGGLS